MSSHTRVGYSNHFNLFSNQPLERSHQSTETIPIYPVASLDSNGPIDIIISSNSIHFLDLNSSWLEISGRVLKKDGSELDSNDDVTPVNLFCSSLFSEVQVSFNDTDINDPRFFPFKWYVSTIFDYNDADRNSILSAGLYYASETTRKDLIANSKSFELWCKLGDNIFNTVQYIPHFVDVRISMKRNNAAFSLIAKDKTVAGTSVAPSNDDHKIVLDKVIFHCKKIIPHQDIIGLLMPIFTMG